MSVKKLIEEILNKTAINQQKLAEKLGVSPAQICRWLREETEPRAKYLLKLQAIYAEVK